MDKRIFLDIDGVLNNLKSRREHACRWDSLTDPKVEAERLAGISPRMVRLFNKLVRETGASVVLSSTWRVPEIFGADNTLRRLREEGLDASIEFAGVTEDSWSWSAEQRSDAFTQHGISLNWNSTPTHSRSVEILEFLRKVGAEPNSFIILDDLKGWGKLQSRVVQTNDRDGFTQKHLKKAISLLTSK